LWSRDCCCDRAALASQQSGAAIGIGDFATGRLKGVNWIIAPHGAPRRVADAYKAEQKQAAFDPERWGRKNPKSSLDDKNDRLVACSIDSTRDGLDLKITRESNHRDERALAVPGQDIRMHRFRMLR
jgi:hypothetical protein